MLYLKLEASARLLGILGLGSKLYPGNMQRMLNKDLTRFMQSFSRTPKSSKQKKGSAGRVRPILPSNSGRKSKATCGGRNKSTLLEAALHKQRPNLEEKLFYSDAAR